MPLKPLRKYGVLAFNLPRKFVFTYSSKDLFTKTHFSHYLDEVAKGESFILCKRNKPVAEIRPIISKVAEKRPIGLAKGTFTVPASFFDELPEETISLFSGMTP